MILYTGGGDRFSVGGGDRFSVDNSNFPYKPKPGGGGTVSAWITFVIPRFLWAISWLEASG